ncbi:MAG: hypothetical protein NVSMB6_08480 [Burkholderiaceae bacterium]
MQVAIHDLRQVLPLSGTLHAVHQATIKARVASEVREVLVREGEAVQKGQVLVRMDTTEYVARRAQARGVLEAARGQLDIATKARDNNKVLLDKAFISRNAYDNATSQYRIAQANVDSAGAALDVTHKALADTTIRAPIAGVVANRSIQPGEKVSPDYHLLDIVDLRSLELEAAVPGSDIQRVAVGQEVLLKIEGVAARTRGTVARINPTTQAGSRSIVTYVTVDNPQQTLRVGMFAEGQLTLTKRNAVLTVPPSAIRYVDGKPTVYMIDHGILQQVPVALGITGDDGGNAAVEVTEGLVDGAQVVQTNLGNLLPGTSVTFANTKTTPVVGPAFSRTLPANPPTATSSSVLLPSTPPGESRANH